MDSFSPHSGAHEKFYLCTLCSRTIPFADKNDHLMCHQLQNMSSSSLGRPLNSQSSVPSHLTEKLKEEYCEPILYTINQLKDIPGGTKDCSICLEDFKVGDLAAILPCFHVFHMRCFKDWSTRKHLLCPLCNNPYKVPNSFFPKTPSSKKKASKRKRVSQISQSEVSSSQSYSQSCSRMQQSEMSSSLSNNESGVSQSEVRPARRNYRRRYQNVSESEESEDESEDSEEESEEESF